MAHDNHKTCIEQNFSFEPGRGAFGAKMPGLPPEGEMAPPLMGPDHWSADAAPIVGDRPVRVPAVSRLGMVRPFPPRAA